ncbi:Putative ribonuclease H protein At1g65750 [Linum grandiflorum]
MTPPDGQLGMDSVAWGLEPSGKFTIKSAYLLLKDLHDETANLRWKAVWRWQGPNNIRHFLWLASHNRLLTNEERGRQHHTTQVFCSFCSSHTESCVHILRDCTFAHQFWSKVLPQVITGHELSKVWSVWLDEHIRCQSHTLVFGVGIWLLWRARNKCIFEQDKETFMDVAHRCDYWVSLISSSWKTGQLGREVLSSTRQTQMIGWRPGDEGWFTLSTDGSLWSSQRNAAAGGVIRDWEVTLHHIYREANYAADYLANLGHSFIFGFHIVNLPNGGLSHWLCYDVIGVSLPRSVSIKTNI